MLNRACDECGKPATEHGVAVVADEKVLRFRCNDHAFGRAACGIDKEQAGVIRWNSMDEWLRSFVGRQPADTVWPRHLCDEHARPMRLKVGIKD